MAQKYNSKKTIVMCEIKECGNKADHAHHIKEQATADKRGFVGHVRVHHQHNLVGLCESCHRKVHEGKIEIQGYMMTSCGMELFYTIHE